MFIVEPLSSPSKIRSPLGFMSLATKWGNILYPGITVLTTDFLQLAIMLHECASLKKKTKSKDKTLDILKSRTTHQKLEREWRKYKKDDSLKDTVMTYWQRYGSMFEYFQLYAQCEHFVTTQDPKKTAQKLHRLVFSATHGRAKDDPKERARRIRHTLAFQKIAGKIQKPLENGSPDEKTLWWITGQGVVENTLFHIHLVRQLEFALSIWQTYFEICIHTYPILKKFPTPRPTTLKAIVAKLIARARLEESASPFEEDFKLAGQLLYIHKTYLAKAMPKWQKKVRKTFPDSKLVILYDGTTISDFCKIPPKKLFDKLLRLHILYCDRQGKDHAKYVQKGQRHYRVVQYPPSSFRWEFNAGRCGLFGYRMGAAINLFSSTRRA